MVFGCCGASRCTTNTILIVAVVCFLFPFVNPQVIGHRAGAGKSHIVSGKQLFKEPLMEHLEALHDFACSQ